MTKEKILVRLVVIRPAVECIIQIVDLWHEAGRIPRIWMLPRHRYIASISKTRYEIIGRGYRRVVNRCETDECWTSEIIVRWHFIASERIHDIISVESRGGSGADLIIGSRRLCAPY